jgi:protein dithiol oxidoreductase (disulfide-forming)
MMKRRDFSISLLPPVLAAPAAIAQSAPIEGKHFVSLAQPLATTVGRGKIEVIEFFWYGCPHCHAFEPALEIWMRHMPADVVFRRVPAAFRPEPFGAHQRIFYALENLDILASMHRKVFYAIHVDRLQLSTPTDISAFMVKNGVDADKFMQAFNSPATTSKQRQADQLVDAYKIDGVPAMGVQGRYYTSGTLAGSPDRALDVVDWLVKRLRNKRI